MLPRAASPLFALLLLACDEPRSGRAVNPALSKEPVSVRGWIAEIDTGEPTAYRTVETEAARRAQLFQTTSVWIENAPFVSGGLAENGSFILLDVPPGKVAVTFSTPGVGQCKLLLESVPGNADVLVPGVILRRGSVAVADPKAIRIRLPAREPRAQTGLTARVAGHAVAVAEVELRTMVDRREYPPPGGISPPVATVR